MQKLVLDKSNLFVIHASMYIPVGAVLRMIHLLVNSHDLLFDTITLFVGSKPKSYISNGVDITLLTTAHIPTIIAGHTAKEE